MSVAQSDPAADPFLVLAEKHRLALEKLREKAMDIAMRLHAQSEEPDADLGAIAGQFTRVARAVRQTIVLEARFSEEDLMRRMDMQADRNRREAQQRSQRLHSRTGEVIEAAAPMLEATDHYQEFREHLLDLRDDEDFLDRPVDDIIAEICGELGIDRPLAEAASPTRPKPQPSGPKPRLVPAPEPEPKPKAAAPSFERRPQTAVPIPVSQLVNWGGPAPDSG